MQYIRSLALPALPRNSHTFADQQLIRRLSWLHTELYTDLQRLCAYLQQIIIQTEQAERSLQTKANTDEQDDTTAPVAATLADVLLGSLRKDVMKLTTRFHHSLSPSKNLFSYLKNGVCAGIYAGFDAMKYTIGKSMKYLQTNASLALGKAHISLDAKATLFDDKKFTPALTLSAVGKAALAECKAVLSIGNDYVHADGEASVGVGVISGEAKAVINKEELTLKAEAGAAAVRGEAKASFTIFGITIEAIGSAELGAIGAGAEFSSKKGEFTIGGKASLLAGLGFKIRVKYD